MRNPSLYQINTRVWLTELSRKLGRIATLDEIADEELDRLRDAGFDFVWFLSVWRTGVEAQRVSRINPGWRKSFEETLEDLLDDDIAGSGFAITAYETHELLGGDAALARLRGRLHQRGLRLILDFVPNHMGLGHPWMDEHPDYFVQGTPEQLEAAPENYTRVQTRTGDKIFAYGRDPYFSGWPDTLQIDYANPSASAAMSEELSRVAARCDGVRCDMAMLVLPEVFARTWNRQSVDFWPDAIERVRAVSPEFLFIAEVYWDMEWTMQRQGFDYAYDKRLYDRLREGHARPVREHFLAELDYQSKLARFLENHDEPRAAAIFSPAAHRAVAVLTYFSPGLRFFHQGQFEGRRVHVSPHLVRAPQEMVEEPLQLFYDRLLTALRRPIVREGAWRMLESTPAWEGNPTHEDVIVFAWELPGQNPVLAVVNFRPHQSQCLVSNPFADAAGKVWDMTDQLSDDHFTWNGDDLCGQGLFLDLAPWQASVYEFAPQV